jgi:hypothetical protein
MTCWHDADGAGGGGGEVQGVHAASDSSMVSLPRALSVLKR